MGNTMQTEVVPLTGMKQGNNLADYEVASVVPREISVTYDRYKEATFTIEKNIKYTTGDKYFIPTPNISETEVVVSGPESSVNKVSRVSLDYEIPDLITESKSFSCALTAYDQTNKPMKLSELFLTMSVDSVDVSLEVLSRQTVALDIPVLNVPEGYSASRITIEPKTIDIAGDYETVSKYKTLTLPNNIDFSKVNTKNFSFEMDIPMPAGVKNVSEVEKATITANLNGFQEQSFNVENLQMVNVPEKKSATLVTKS
ncbi:MAG: CdaR family protein, partial [Oscillospiraceae bacterium]